MLGVLLGSYSVIDHVPERDFRSFWTWNSDSGIALSESFEVGDWAYPPTAQNTSRTKQQRSRIGTDCSNACEFWVRLATAAGLAMHGFPTLPKDERHNH